ncbi:MAG: hypothetical protein PF447_08245 [Spirochaetaceae bacterium]|jgi:homoserine trans-succinylase|nr:hypothetical protein [Spirochaetaceae bacterium]
MEPVELQRERISAISQEIFPTELWMFQQKENKPLQPEHQMLGAMMGNPIQRDEQYIWEASKNLLTDPTTHIDNYSKNYNVVILQEKIKHIMNGVELIDFGRPKIEGSLAEIAFLVQKDDSKMMGYIYWSFDEHWLIEDLALK